MIEWWNGARQWAASRRGVTVPVAALLVVVAAIGIESLMRDTDEPALPIGESAAANVTYYVEGTPRYASLTMETPTGSKQIEADVPLSKAADGSAGLEFTFRRGAFAYISAQIPSDHGEITCRIEVDGVTISENTSSGGYAIATCKGSV